VKRLIDDRSLLKGSSHTTVFERLLELFPHPDEHTLTYLTQEANTLVTAGSETTASVLEVGLFRILQNEKIYNRLFEELKTAIPDVHVSPKYTTLQKLPYLVCRNIAMTVRALLTKAQTACVKESLRVTYGVLGALPRVTPPGGVRVQGYEIPAGVSKGLSVKERWNANSELHRPSSALTAIRFITTSGFILIATPSSRKDG
jgi:cytochrome P450